MTILGFAKLATLLWIALVWIGVLDLLWRLQK